MNLFSWMKPKVKTWTISEQQIAYDRQKTYDLYIKNLKMGLNPEKHVDNHYEILRIAKRYEGFLGAKITFHNEMYAFDHGLLVTYPDGKIETFSLISYPFYDYVLKIYQEKMSTTVAEGVENNEG